VNPHVETGVMPRASEVAEAEWQAIHDLLVKDYPREEVEMILPKLRATFAAADAAAVVYMAMRALEEVARARPDRQAADRESSIRLLMAGLSREDAEFLLFEAPKLRELYQRAARLRQADADGQRGGRPPKYQAKPDQIQRAAEEVRRRKPKLLEQSKEKFYLEVSEQLGWKSEQIDRIRRTLRGSVRLKQRSWDWWVARYPEFRRGGARFRDLWMRLQADLGADFLATRDRTAHGRTGGSKV